MVEVIPGTSRGREFKKLLALTMLQSTVSSRVVDISCYRRLLRNSAVRKCYFLSLFTKVFERAIFSSTGHFLDEIKL